MNTIRRLVLCVLLAVALTAPAAPVAPVAPVAPDADDLLEHTLAGLSQTALAGNLDYPLRVIDALIAKHPDDPRPLQLKTRLLELRERSLGAMAGPPGAVIVMRPRATTPAAGPREPVAGSGFTTETAGVSMIWIEPGTFHMASVHGSDDDTRVTLSRGYWLGRTEVTQAQWQAVMENLPRPSLFKGGDRPVERVAWPSAMEFCHKLNARERAAGRVPAGYAYTLPTEAQWEYACRAGTTGKFAGEIEALAWMRATSGAQTRPVATKRPNAWGFHDMHGNVSEWCVDGYQGYPGGAAVDPRGDYLAPSAGMFRIVRGGSWDHTPGECRSDYRLWVLINTRNPATGFRLALTQELRGE